MTCNTTPVLRPVAAILVSLALGAPAGASVTTVPTMDPAALAASLRPTGLTIDSVVIRNGLPGQFGTYSNFDKPPVTIHDGIVLSSGDVTNLGPFPEAADPEYDPAGPPAVVNNQMNFEVSGGTPEFNAYGVSEGNIESFVESFDVAALEVHFSLDAPAQVKFDFIFGSVEYPAWVSQFTDAFLVFLDGETPADQIAYDAAGNAVQVGSSFAGLTTTDDRNSAFSAPHGLIHHLTTTTTLLEDGEHTLIFEVGDVNDQILDSAVFIANLRTGAGDPGTEPSDDCRGDYNESGAVSVQDIFDFLADYFRGESDADFNGSGVISVQDIFDFLAAYFTPCD